MKKFKIVVSFLLAFSLVLVSGQTVNAAVTNILGTAELPQNAIYLSRESKQLFVEQAEEKYAADLANGKIKTYSQERVNDLIEKATFATGVEKDRILAELSQYGVYAFNTASTSNSGNLRYDTSYITMTAPNIYYTMSLSTWTITCGGSWNSVEYDMLMTVGDVGGLDGFGVGYTNTSGTYDSHVVSVYGFISDENGDYRVSTSSRSDGNGMTGFGFRLQDKISDTNTYIGYIWYGSCIYDAEFSSYDGIATAYYIHTYEEAEISAVSFNMSLYDIGIGITIENSEYSFVGYSNDTRF